MDPEIALLPPRILKKIDVLIVLNGLVKLGEEIKKNSHIVADLSLEYDEVISGSTSLL